MNKNKSTELPYIPKALTVKSNDVIYEYIKQVNCFPILTEEEEKGLLSDFFYNQNQSAGKKF